MIPFSGDPFVESGIRPDPEAGNAFSAESGGILVEWRELTAGQTLAVAIGGYHLYRADSVDGAGAPRDFVRIATISETPVGNDTTFTDTAVGVNVRYWYVVRAFTRSTGAEGPPSDTVFYSMSARPLPISPAGELDSSDVAPLRFRYGPQLVGGEVAIHLYRVRPDNERIVLDTVWRSRAHGTFNDPQVVYAGPPLASGASYRWRVDKVLGNQPTGNASRWVTFVAP